MCCCDYEKKTDILIVIFDLTSIKNVLMATMVMYSNLELCDVIECDLTKHHHRFPLVSRTKITFI